MGGKVEAADAQDQPVHYAPPQEVEADVLTSFAQPIH